MNRGCKVAVVIPSYRVRSHILKVINSVGPEVSRIYVVDDSCPEGSGQFVSNECQDGRVSVITLSQNQGVGGAVMTGYKAAINDGMDIVVKVDGDGQMDPELIPEFIRPIVEGDADYTKGNRFYDLEMIRQMPGVRLFGNAVLSFMAKLSTGYWNLFDPTNGYTAIHVDVARRLPFEKISRRYFFETDILFRLNSLRAVVVDVPMEARYGDEISGLKIRKIVGEFLLKHGRNFLKRVFYNYYLRDMSLASIELPVGVFMILIGSGFGLYKWIESVASNTSASAGTVMLAALPVILGIQFILSFLNYDIGSVPRSPIHRCRRVRRANKNNVRG